MKKRLVLGLFIIASVFIIAAVASTINDFFLPGSQPNESGNLESPTKCDNCHGGYDLAVEPSFNWKGSMMSQAMRDPLFLACMAIANQDAPESGDLCIRCHSPEGWLGGRSTPTDGSALTDADREGVHCDFCHRMVKPSQLGVNPFENDSFYTATTYIDDQNYLSGITNIPETNANGMFIVSNSVAKRGPFEDAAAKHQMRYSPFHKESAICGTCHDVSNPVYSKQADGSYTPNSMGQQAPDFIPYSMFPIERTYSEWLMSSYNSETGIYAPQFGGNKNFVSTCQDCHMRDVSGYGCNKNGVPFRHNLPLHDMTGGNTIVPEMVAQLFPNEVNQSALNEGVLRARYMLQNAATMDLDIVPGSNELVAHVRITNETGHKLPSGYPEGRRMWINLKAYNNQLELIYESGAYDPASAYLNHDNDIKVYEIKPGIDPLIAGAVGEAEGPSFHFVLNNKIFSDNRIPPKGFTNSNFELIQSPPVNYSYADGQYWDDTYYNLPLTTARVEATLYYQTLSLEYVTFLKNENTTNDDGNILYSLWESLGKSAPEQMIQKTVNLQPPLADFIGTPLNGYSPLSVQFTDMSLNGATSWAWDFGDGESSAEQNPIHIYTAPGVYTVKLIAGNDYGTNAKERTDYILVEDQQIAKMYVQSINVKSIYSKPLGLPTVVKIKGQAEVYIVDDIGNPVQNAQVNVYFSGPFNGTVSAFTDYNGLAILITPEVNKRIYIFCCEVTDVIHPDYLYDSSLNNIFEACENSSLTKQMLTQDSKPAPEGYGLYQNYPNPFNNRTSISFLLNENSDVAIELFSLKGEKILDLVSDTYKKGYHTIHLNNLNLSPGVYIYRLKTSDWSDVKKLTVVKK